MPSIASRQTLTGMSSTGGFPQWFPDTAIRPFSVAVSAAVNSTGTQTFNIEYSEDYSGSSTFISTAATWFSSGSSAQTSNALAAFSFPVTALRINVTAGASQGTVTATFVQAG
jgi:hypothetical protein